VKLPNPDQAVIQDEKLQGYLLSRAHLVGRFKAAFFNALGYESVNWERLESDIRSLLRNQARKREKTEYG
jgi:N-acetylglutamate synthase-like GNAT family acetyltransferase